MASSIAGVIYMSRNGYRRYAKMTKAVLEGLYIREGLSSRKIADKIGCPTCTVIRYLGYYGIPVRSRSVHRGNIVPIGSTYIHEGYLVKKLAQGDTFFPMCSKKTGDTYGYVFEHRLVMARYLGRCLEPWELVHHINGERADNRIENLELLPSPTEHLSRTTMQQRIKLLEQRITQLEAEMILFRTQVGDSMISNF